ncbi:MAG: hypothetical protein A2Y10_18275 [Planctomycetes bacterium GWF2_41_51]|nr:MAG: hypothetical protein A2Y10_18275 [Planctomycetes bacterium GWF2_41_51]HBG27944.1 hypothetical protein [Phycisphaerales bacterium]
MKAEKLKEIVHLAQKVGYVFIATANTDGMPHMAAAGKLEPAIKDCVAITEWCCPGTLANLYNNKYISIVIWAKDPDNGYQLLGRLNKINDLAILDGYAPKIERKHPVPQIEKQLIIKVEKIIEFKLAPHSDIEE